MIQEHSDKRLDEYLELFTLTEILEQSDLTKRDVLYILYDMGHVALPPFLEDMLEHGGEEQWDTDNVTQLPKS